MHPEERSDWMPDLALRSVAFLLLNIQPVGLIFDDVTGCPITSQHKWHRPGARQLMISSCRRTVADVHLGRETVETLLRRAEPGSGVFKFYISFRDNFEHIIRLRDILGKQTERKDGRRKPTVKLNLQLKSTV